MSLEGNNIKCNVSPNSINGYREVHFTYSYNGKEYKQLVYVKDNPNFKEKDYIREAKKQFKPNYKIQAYSKARIHFPVVPVVASLVIAGGLGTGGYFTYKYFANDTPVAETCLVNFDSDGGSYVASKTVAKGEAFKAPEDPIKKVDTFSYTFDGWFLNDTKFDFSKGTTVDITLKAHWSGTPPVPEGSCIVNFDSDGGTYVASKFVTRGEPFDAPETPTKKEGDFEYTFGGWYLGSNKFKFGIDTVNEDTTLIAHWGGEPTKRYNVTFNGDNANILEGGVNHGDYYTNDYDVNSELSFIIKPSIVTVGLTDAISFRVNGEASTPTTYEKQIDGSYKLEFTVEGTTSIVVNSVNKNKVTFVTNCETKLPDIYVMDGDTIKEPEIKNGGYILIGWFTDIKCTSIFDLASPIYSDLTLYARWSSGDVNQPLTFSVYYAYPPDVDRSIKLSCTNEFDYPISRDLRYKINNDEWVSVPITVQPNTIGEIKTIITDLKQDDKICFDGDNEDGWSIGNPDGDEFILQFVATDINCNISGNVMSLIYSGDDLASQKEIPCEYCFGKLFQNTERIEGADKLVLPATKLKDCCYYYMFESSKLTDMPECLIFDYVPRRACECMFGNILGGLPLSSTPVIKVGDVDYKGFYAMFQNCSIANTISDIIMGDIVGESGCESMFLQCSSPTTIHNIIIGNIIANKGCYEMFLDCDSLQYIGNITIGSAKGNSACESMFNECSNMVFIGMLKIDNYSFGSKSLEKMFYQNFYLKYIEIDIDIPIGKYWFYDENGLIVTDNWFNSLAVASGTFVWHNAPEGVQPIFDNSHIPDGWDVVLC